MIVICAELISSKVSRRGTLQTLRVLSCPTEVKNLAFLGAKNKLVTFSEWPLNTAIEVNFC